MHFIVFYLLLRILAVSGGMGYASDSNKPHVHSVGPEPAGMHFSR